MVIDDLTKSEELVMKAIWDCKKEPVLSDVVDWVNGSYGKDWRPQTVSTFLAKLVRKNYLQMQRDGKIYTYKVLIPEKSYREKLCNQLVSFWYGDDLNNLVKELTN